MQQEKLTDTLGSCIRPNTVPKDGNDNPEYNDDVCKVKSISTSCLYLMSQIILADGRTRENLQRTVNGMCSRAPINPLYVTVGG